MADFDWPLGALYIPAAPQMQHESCAVSATLQTQNLKIHTRICWRRSTMTVGGVVTSFRSGGGLKPNSPIPESH